MEWVKVWNIEEMTGYKPKTTFYEDFGIGERWGTYGIKSTYDMAFDSWKDAIEYITELVMVLNWKVWEHVDTNKEFYKLYLELYEKANKWCLKNLKGDDLRYYLEATN